MTRFPFSSTLRLCVLACSLWSVVALVPAVSAEEKAKDASIIYPRNSEAGKTENPAAPLTARVTAAEFWSSPLLLAGAAGWLFWRGRAAPGGAINVRKLAIAETKSLGNRQYLVVAAYENKKFLLSVCPGRIELLTPLDDSSPVKLP